jgi:hypothetical protein
MSKIFITQEPNEATKQFFGLTDDQIVFSAIVDDNASFDKDDIPRSGTPSELPRYHPDRFFGKTGYRSF